MSRSASSIGLAIVALASRKRGSVPWIAATRRSRRSTLATCEPNTPRYTCASSTTTNARFASSSPHACVVGKDPDVEHVGVGEDQVAALADRRALLARRVAVVDRGPDRLVQPERVERARLVLGERLGRVQVQRAGGAVGGQHLERRQLEAQRLARRGPGRDDRRAVERRSSACGLVGVELGDAGVVQGARDQRVEVVRDRRHVRGGARS